MNIEEIKKLINDAYKNIARINAVGENQDLCVVAKQQLSKAYSLLGDEPEHEIK